MALVLKYVDDINRYLNKYEDPRTAKWPMMSSPFYTLGCCFAYVFFVKVLGPKLMENRKPFHLQRLLIVYNFLQILLSAYLFYEIGMGGWFTRKYNWRCQPVDYSNSPDSVRMTHASYWYYMSKFTEFMDTIFFVLRKKKEQITTLHVIHHGVMPMSVWFGVKFTPGGHSTFFGLLNTFVHIVMYTYYMLSAIGPSMQKYLWWKKYLTTLQMVQFIAIMLHAFQLLFIDCNYPRAFVWWIGMHAVMFFFLFKEFYISSYNKQKTKRERLAAAAALTAGMCHPPEYTTTATSQNGNAAANGNAATNGVAKANDYYVNGNSNGQLHHRIK